MSVSEAPAPVAARRGVLRNTLYLTVSQALTVPLAVLMNGFVARYLGAGAYGYAYLASTLTTFGFLAVTWGHEGVLPAVVARDTSLAGTMLGSSVAWRTVVAVGCYPILAAACYFLGYDSELQWAFALTWLASALGTVVAACKDTIRGFERTDIPAIAHVGQQFLAVLLVIPVLMLGGKLRAALAVQVVAAAAALVAVWRTLRPVGVGTMSPRWNAVKQLFSGGTPFVFFGLAMALQPNIDALFLSKLAPVDVMGWYAVSRRLVGVLLFPASALIGALYPTLCRLHVEDQEAFNATTRDSLRGVSLAAIPVALGSALFPDIGIAIFGRASFGRAAEDLKVLSIFVFLVYFTMPLGTTILASGKQRAWSVVQSLCVAISLILDPLLVPVFQRQNGNGGMGLCIASVASEAIVILCGVALAPRGIFDLSFFRSMVPSVLSAGVMAVVAFVASPLGSFVAAPVSLVAYAGSLWATGGLDKQHVESIRGFFARKFSRPA